jgi:hypothetical protein
MSVTQRKKAFSPAKKRPKCGDFNADKSRRFWSRVRGSEYWVTPQRFEVLLHRSRELQRLSLRQCVERRMKGKKARIKRGQFSPDGKSRFWCYKRGLEYWVTLDKFDFLLKRDRERSVLYGREIMARFKAETAVKLKQGETPVKIKRGQLSADGRSRFWGYTRGKEYWVSHDNFETFTKRDEKTRRAREQSPEGRARINAWARQRIKQDPAYAVRVRLRHRLLGALKRYEAGATKFDSTEKLLGCSFKAFVAYLESLFLPGMSWSNRSQWHIDHKLPCCAFDLTREEEQRRCFHYTNLQPLWARDNLSKGGRH